MFLILIVLKIDAGKKVACLLFSEWSQKKHNKMTLKTNHEAMKVFDKNGPNKEVAIQFNLPGSKIATWKKNKEKTYQAF